MMHDDLEHVLKLPAPKQDVEPDTGLLLRTTQLLHQRVLWKRRLQPLFGVLLFFLGIGTGWFLKPAPHQEVAEKPYLQGIDPTQAIETVPASSNSALIGEVVSIDDLEIQAELAKTRSEKSRLYQAVGHRYFEEQKNYAEAARCYELHLQTATAEERQPHLGDNWLLLSMKTRYSMEDQHAFLGH